MENQEKEVKQEEIVSCGGSFRIGTACTECKRCKARGYTKEMKAAAIEAEKERTKHLPPNRVKSAATQTIRIENPEVIIQGIEERKPE